MLRTSLSDRRRIVDNLNRWCASSRNNRRIQNAQRKRSYQYQLSWRSTVSKSAQVGIFNDLPQRAIAASMSTKPSFDTIYDDDEEVDNGDGYQLKWVNQASLDNFSQYDNFLQYDSNNDDGGSLLDLINKEDDAQKHLDRVESSMMMLLNEDTGELIDVENIRQSSTAEATEDSLLDLLDAPDIYEDEEPLSDLLNEETKDETQWSKYKDLQSV